MSFRGASEELMEELRNDRTAQVLQFQPSIYHQNGFVGYRHIRGQLSVRRVKEPLLCHAIEAYSA